MTEEEKKRIRDYIKQAIYMPLAPKQLVSMVILHFDMPDEEAECAVELALIELAKARLTKTDKVEENILIVKGTEHPEERVPIYKVKDVYLEKERIASDILKVWCPNDEYKKLDGSELILLNMKCHAVAEYVIATCQGKAPKPVCLECGDERWVWVNHGSNGYSQDPCPTCQGTGKKCICPIMDNQEGIGGMLQRPVINLSCPVHGDKSEGSSK